VRGIGGAGPRLTRSGQAAAWTHAVKSLTLGLEHREALQAMKRREFITLLGGAAVAWPLAARGQQPRSPRIGVLHPFSPPDPWAAGLRRGLRDLGYVSEGHDERLDALAKELMDNRVDVLVTITGAPFFAARRLTTTLPIVMAISGDGVGAPGVASLARPGGNVTGTTMMNPELDGLRLSMLREAVPSAKRIAVIYNPNEAASVNELRKTEDAAKTLDIDLQSVEAPDPEGLDQAFQNALAGSAGAFFTFAHAFAFSNRVRIAELAAKYRLPGMYGWPEFAEAGGLMVYGPNVADILYRAASFVDRILKGEKPAELPIEQPTRFELIINLKTAKALGLEIPAALLARADKVIE
jgi:putative tryptophan/tyrosine transport system substrate-binding protein